RAVIPGSASSPEATASDHFNGSTTFWIVTVVNAWRAAQSAQSRSEGTGTDDPSIASVTEYTANLWRSSVGTRPTTSGSLDCTDSDCTQASRSERGVR